jgi:hypothetical protein
MVVVVVFFAAYIVVVVAVVVLPNAKFSTVWRGSSRSASAPVRWTGGCTAAVRTPPPR